MPLLHDHALAHRGPFARKNAPLHYTPDLRLEPHHLALDLTVDIPGRTLGGTATFTVRANADHVRTLALDAAELEIEGVATPDGDALAYTYDDATLRITWPSNFARGEERQIVITYRAVSPSTALYFSAPDEAYPDAPYYMATDNETQRARHWVPCIDHPSARCTLDIRLTAEADLTLLANGALASEEANEDGTKTARWVLDQPCPAYLMCLAVGRFTRADDTPFGEVECAYFGAHTTKAEDLIRSFGRTAEMLAWMTERLGVKYPYPKYYQFALPAFGGAMENISLVSWDAIFVLDETLDREWGWLVDQINVHEMAHTFFGDAIVCRDFSQAWLKESWATYIETCWLEHKCGADEQLYDFYRNRETYFNEADGQYKRPIVTRKFDSAWQLYDAHLYPGGAVRLHMLRRMLGDDVFWSAVQEYTQTYMGETVETHDFRRIMERHAGRDLNQFFDQWIYTAGYPALKVTYAWDGDSNRATFTVEQSQFDPKSKTPEHVFHVKLDLGWVIDGELHTATIPLTNHREVYTVELPAEPQQVRVDPDNKLVIKLNFNPGDALLQTQLTDAPDVIGRIYAGRELAKTAKRKNLQAIADAYADEPFWGVRQQWASALGKARTADALDHLLALLPGEEDGLVQETLVRALAHYRDPRIVSTLVEKLPTLGYRASAAAYEVLGKQRDNAPLDALTEAATTETFSDFPQHGALRALAQTRSEDTLETLLAMTRWGAAPHLARQAAAQGLGELALYLKRPERERAVETLIDLLRDPSDRVRFSAARALGTAKAREAIPALISLYRSMTQQDQVDLKPIIDGLRSSDDAKLKSLEKTVEELRGELRKALQRLDTLEAKG